MSLIPNLSLLQRAGCRSIKLFEETGAYAADNLGGYGVPNPEISDVASAEIVVTMPNGDIVAFNITADFAAVFPTTDNSVPLELTNVNFGLASDDTLPPGIYVFDYRLYDISVNLLAQGKFYFIIDCALKCCLANLLATLQECDCCDDKSAKLKNLRVRMAYIYLEAAHAAAACGKYGKAQAMLDFVEDVCAESNCQCN